MLRVLAPLALVALALGVPAPQDATLTPTTDAPAGNGAAAPAVQTASSSAPPDGVALSVGEGQPLRIISLQATNDTSPPPPVTTNAACTSHDVYIAVLEAVSISSENMTIASAAQPQDVAPADQATQIVVLCAIGILSLGLLILGSTFMNAALGATLFLVSFWFAYGVADNVSYDSAEPATFSMCVMPFVLAVLAGALSATMALCLVQRYKWLSFFLLGASIGGIAAYLIRDVIIDAAPGIARTPGFRFYWLACAAVAVLFGLIAAWLKTVIYFVATIIVGSYGFSTFICGLIPVVGGSRVGSAAFIAIMIGSAAIGGVVQYLITKKDKPAYDEKKEGLVNK